MVIIIATDNERKHLFMGLASPSVHVLDRKLQLQPTFVMAWANALSQHNQWSRETAEHITAIHFCYMLLQQEKHELQRKEERKRQSRWIQECRKDRAATESIISMPDSSTVTVIPTLHHKVTGQEQYPLTPSEAIELRMQPHQYTIEEWSDGGKKSYMTSNPAPFSKMMTCQSLQGQMDRIYHGLTSEQK